MTDPNGLVTTFTYNAADLLVSQTETPPPGGGLTRTTTFTYDAAGQLTQMVTPNGITLTLDYDPKGRLIRVTDNLNQKVEYTYAAEGNLTQTDVKDPDATLATTVQQTFDNLNRLQSISQPHVPGTDSVTQVQYDDAGNQVGQTDPNGNVSSSSYDPGDRLIQRNRCRHRNHYPRLRRQLHPGCQRKYHPKNQRSRTRDQLGLQYPGTRNSDDRSERAGDNVHL